MSGITFNVTGSSNDTNLVLSSANAAIHEGDHDEEHDHLLRSNILDVSLAVVALKAKDVLVDASITSLVAKDVLLTGNILDVSLAVVALRAKDVLVDASITSLVAKDVVLTGNIVDISSAVVALRAKDVQIDASINNVKNNILDLQNNDALEMSYSAASASIAQYIFKTVTLPLANSCISGGDYARINEIPPVWNFGVGEQILQFPSIHYSPVFPNIGDNISDPTDVFINVAYPKNYVSTKNYHTMLYIENDVNFESVAALKLMQEDPSFLLPFKGTDLSDGFFLVGIRYNSNTTTSRPEYPYIGNGTGTRNFVLAGFSLNTPQPEDDLLYFNFINMLRIEILPFLRQKYAGMTLTRDTTIMNGWSFGGYTIIKTMLLFPELAKRWIAHSPGIRVAPLPSVVNPLLGSNAYQYGYDVSMNSLTGKPQIQYKVDQELHRKHISFMRDNAKRIAGLGFEIQLATWNNFGTAKDLYDNCGNTPGSILSGTGVASGYDNIGYESFSGGFTVHVLPHLLEAGFSVAPALDHQTGISGDRLVTSKLKVFNTELSKNFADHAWSANTDNTHELLCKLYAVPDASFSHVNYLNTKTYSDKKDFKAHNLTTKVDASFNLFATFNQINTRMWKTRYTLVNGYADGSNAVFDTMQRFRGSIQDFSSNSNPNGSNNNVGNVATRSVQVFKLLPSDPSGKTLKVEFLNKENVALGTTTTVVTSAYKFTASYFDTSNVWLAYDASLNYDACLNLINTLV